ncbi:MAG: putative toxin-antitoxin system toxin component, PIN family [Bacteroidetes bacterium CHB5]|nr:putative toxin-antitoxin system toxin component, PIN family [Bacteroidetes bacterium CHB5]
MFLAVIDTNCLLASIPPQSNHYWLYEAFKNERFERAVSNEILTEYEEKIANRYSGRTASLVLSLLSVAPNVIFAEAFFKWQLIEADPDDNKFADLAIAVNADYLVTNDKDFHVLKKIDFPKVNVVSLDEFFSVIP